MQMWERPCQVSTKFYRQIFRNPEAPGVQHFYTTLKKDHSVGYSLPPRQFPSTNFTLLLNSNPTLFGKEVACLESVGPIFTPMHYPK